MKRNRILDCVLNRKICGEYHTFREEILARENPEEIYGRAYQITVMYDLYLALMQNFGSFNAEEKHCLLAMPEILWQLYETWMKAEDNSQSQYRESIYHTIQEQKRKQTGGAA